MKEKIIIADKENNLKNFKWLVFLFLIIIVIDSGIIIFYSFKILEINQNLDLIKKELNEKIDTNNVDVQNKISELSKSIIETRTDLKKEVGNIKAKTSSDFSGIIDSAKNSVVSVRTDYAQGTGFIISRDGYVITNAHVLYDATLTEAVTSNQEIKEMKFIGYNSNLDLALLKIEGEYPYLELGDSDNVKVGEKVIAIGNPLGLSFSVSEGIVSAVHRTGTNQLPAYIQTDASLNPGNSGGPLIDVNGKVIGMNNFKARAESIGFALESNYIKNGINGISLKKLNMTILD